MIKTKNNSPIKGLIKINNRYSIVDKIALRETNQSGEILEIRKYLYAENFQVVLSYRKMFSLEEEEKNIKILETIYKSNFFIGYDIETKKYKTFSFTKQEVKYIIKLMNKEKLVSEKDIRLSKKWTIL